MHQLAVNLLNSQTQALTVSSLVIDVQLSTLVRASNNPLEDAKSKVRGKMVMLGKQTVVPVNFTVANKRTPDEQIKTQYSGEGGGRGRGGNGGGDGRGAVDPARMDRS